MSDCSNEWLVFVIGSIALLSELLPYIKRTNSNGIFHLIHNILKSECCSKNDDGDDGDIV